MDLKSFIPENKRDDERYKDVPMIVAPGHEEEYLRTLAEQEEAQKKKTGTAQSESEEQHPGQQPQQEQTPESGQNENQQQTNESGWDSFLRTFGLDAPRCADRLVHRSYEIFRGKGQSVARRFHIAGHVRP